MKSKRLGRGLEALIPQTEPEDELTQSKDLSQIEIAEIKVNPQQPRHDFNAERLEQLKQSIHENGIIQPITIRRVEAGYELISGERRLRAVRELGHSEIPAYILDVDSDDRLLELALIENIQREDLNPVEIAEGYHKLQKEYGLTQEEVAQKVGKDRATVANFIRLLKAPGPIIEALRNDKISMGHARAMMGLPNNEDQIKMCKRAVEQGWSVRKTEESVRSSLEIKKHPARQSHLSKDPELVKIEDRLRTIFATQVQIKPSNKGGKIELAYYSNDDLDRIVEFVRKLEE